MEDVARRGRRASLAAVLALAWAALIFWASSRPAGDLPPSFPHADKLVHAAVYAVLGALVAVALGRGRPLPARAAGLALALAVAYGVSDELHQGFVPGRDVSLLDLVADTVGAAAGIFAVARRSRREA